MNEKEIQSRKEFLDKVFTFNEHMVSRYGDQWESKKSNQEIQTDLQDFKEQKKNRYG